MIGKNVTVYAALRTTGLVVQYLHILDQMETTNYMPSIASIAAATRVTYVAES